jgi:hypothetical protein
MSDAFKEGSSPNAPNGAKLDEWQELNQFAITHPNGWTIARYTVLGQDKYLQWDPGGTARGTSGGIGPAKSAVKRLARE